MEKLNGKLTNILQGVIITMLTGFGIIAYGFRNESRADTASLQKSVNEIKINQAVFKTTQQQVTEDLKQNKQEHKEIFKLLRK